jgi:hypothetical protein
MCYSFSKSQFAFWSLIVFVAYGYIWLVTKDFNTLNETALVLLGISSATIVTGKLIGKSEEERAKAADKEEKSDIDNIKRDQGQTENQQLGRHIQQLIKFRSWKPGEHGGFLKDILSDADGISVHRLQAFAFNLIFAIIFVQQVLTTYSMPDFTATHYILLGLSNGTYAFIKTRENG